MRKEKRSKKKKFIGLIFGFFERENVELIILGLLAFFISIFGHAIYTNHSQIQAQFDALAMSVRDLSYVDNDLYTDCNNKRDYAEIIPDMNLLRQKLQTLIDQHANMGNLVSLDTYCSIHQFTLYNNQLKSAGENVCKLPLKAESETDEWRDQILKIIYTNRESRRGPINSIRDYFSDKQENVPTPDKCK